MNLFPIQNGKLLRAVPYALVEQHEAQAMKNHAQTVKRLKERAGLDVCELAAVLTDQHWTVYQTKGWPTEDCECICLQRAADFLRGAKL